MMRRLRAIRRVRLKLWPRTDALQGGGHEAHLLVLHAHVLHVVPMLGGNVLQEGGDGRGLLVRPNYEVREEEVRARARHCHVEEPALLLYEGCRELVPFRGYIERNCLLIAPDDEHDGPFEALGAVDRGERQRVRVVPLLAPVIWRLLKVGERHMLHKRAQSRHPVAHPIVRGCVVVSGQHIDGGRQLISE
eukprot:scaffold121119_cov28-Tisochrysis_lutea.AAC.4